MKLLLFLGLACPTVFAQFCGYSNVSTIPHSTHIVGGSVAKESDFPWQVGLAENGYLICGGVLIDSFDSHIVVLTAAHCMRPQNDASAYSLAFGMHSIMNAGSRKVVGCTSFTPHELYNSSTLANDIAILRVENLADVDAVVKETWAYPVCLPSRYYFHDEDVLVSGWGSTSEGGSSSDLLQYVWKKALGYNECQQTGNGGYLDVTMMCAGESGRDACQGDSGGPLVAYRGGFWELVGLVSWGFGCGRPNYPGVYADVMEFRSWIEQNI